MKHSNAWIEASTINLDGQPKQPSKRDLGIKEQYIKLDRIGDIAEKHGISRQAVWKILRRLGVDTSSRQGTERQCPVCDSTIPVSRGDRKHHNSYCSSICYRTYLSTLGETYKPSAYHSRLSRKAVIEAWPEYQPGVHIVHHIDKDCHNTSLSNLMVFANQADHLRYHRGIAVEPLWRGRDYHQR
jgi:hypothetical protein